MLNSRVTSTIRISFVVTFFGVYFNKNILGSFQCNFKEHYFEKTKLRRYLMHCIVNYY